MFLLLNFLFTNIHCQFILLSSLLAKINSKYRNKNNADNKEESDRNIDCAKLSLSCPLDKQVKTSPWFEYPQYEALEKAMASHSSTLAWKIPWTEEPGGLQSMQSRRVGYDWATLLSLFTFMHWRRKWQPTPMFLSGESQGRGSLVGCHLWGRTESDMTEAT